MDEVRDIVVIAALIGLTAVALVAAIVVGVAGYVSLRLLRLLRRLHDRHVLPAVERGDSSLGEWAARGPLSTGEVLQAVLRGLRLLIQLQRRKRRRKRRFGFLAR